MGSHRADHRAPQPAPASGYTGKRVAQRAVSEAPSTYVGKRVARAAETPSPAPVVSPVPLVVEPVLAGLLERTPTVELPALRDIALLGPVTDSSTQLRAVGAPGKRRATRHSGARGPLFKGLPTLPVAVGVATLAVAVGGAVVSADPQLAAGGDRVAAANAMTGSFGNGSITDRVETVSRDSDRDTLQQANGADLVEKVELSVKQRDTALDDLAKAAEKEAAEIALNKWVTPLASYRLTATFGEYGLWSSYHTGLDFAAPSGTPIRAVTNGVVTSAGFDGAYGNKTVVTLEDGTELWFCHQSAFNVSVGDTVRTGELIGYVGSTGHVTGPHLHLEVRPGGGDPVDPDAALRQHGVTP
ncbi:MAG TPA: M23 family metallopeptidase [Nocardioides sp.]|nr:M23 family metallopeptidase [Nocardioides sp.]